MKNLGSLLPLLLLGVFFYVLVLRPAQRRQRAAAAVQNELTPGVQIMTTGGLFGTVVEVLDDRLTLEIAPGTVVEFAKGAVGRVVPPVSDPTEPAEATPDTTDAEDATPDPAQS